jgi:PAS domain S-box-containing protein
LTILLEEWTVKQILIIGARQLGMELLKALLILDEVRVAGVVDDHLDAPGALLAKEHGVRSAACYDDLIDVGLDAIFETTGSASLYEQLEQCKAKQTDLISKSMTELFLSTMEGNAQLQRQIESQKSELDTIHHSSAFLEAIINCSEDAISVVDANGNGMLINPAYTRLTGLSREDVIGKPADVDISEGESMHMKVLKTRKKVRGAHMKVGPGKKDVIVNVAPVIVEGEIKGSVGVVHDVTEFKMLDEELKKAKQIIRKLEAKYTFDDIIGGSEAMQLALDQARKAALTPATVLLRGESGTGKELFAHAIHNASTRKFNQFIRVNCAAISDQLLESELFGYEEGAFTGARKGGRRGLFEEASGGTIFLDEIGEMAPNTQAKLLRVLQEKEIIRVGASKPIPVDVRIIAATNVNLEKAIQQGHFREDLYYRLNVMPIFIPPLRYRKEDLLSLSHHLIRKFNQDYGRAVAALHPEAIAKLTNHEWPGNVRELENVLGRSIINMRFTESQIQPHHLPELGNGGRPEHLAAFEGVAEHRGDSKLSDVLNRVEKETIKRIYAETNGNKTETARRLGLSIRNLYYKMEKYQLV